MVPTTKRNMSTTHRIVTRSNSAPTVVHWSKYRPPTYHSTNSSQVDFVFNTSIVFNIDCLKSFSYALCRCVAAILKGYIAPRNFITYLVLN